VKRLEFIGAERMVGITGREIFQKERVDKDDQEAGDGLGQGTGNRELHWKSEKALTAWRPTEANGKGRPQGSPIANGSEEIWVVIWKPNQIFDKSDSKGARSRERLRPFRFCGKKRLKLELRCYWRC
jgi:hypothetical protein